MTAEPGADELRIRALLVARQVGPDAVPPKPSGRPRDWLDNILDTDPTAVAEEAGEGTPQPRKSNSRLPDWWRDKPERLPNPDDDIDDDPEDAAEETPEPDPDQDDPSTEPVAAKPKAARKKRKKPKPGTPRTAWDTRPPAPRQSLTEAWDAVPYRLKWLAYHASAAYLGWSVGLVGWATYVTAWIADTGPVGPQAFFWYGTAGVTVLVYHRTRSWWWPVAWLAAVPATSTVVGVLLYGTPNP